MSTAVIAAVVAANAGTAAANASAAAHRAAEACRRSMPGFVDATSSIKEKLDYAHCVELLYPPQVSAESSVRLWIVMLVAFALCVGAAVYGPLRSGDYKDAGLMGTVGAIAGVGLAMLILIVYVTAVSITT